MQRKLQPVMSCETTTVWLPDQSQSVRSADTPVCTVRTRSGREGDRVRMSAKDLRARALPESDTLELWWPSCGPSCGRFCMRSIPEKPSMAATLRRLAAVFLLVAVHTNPIRAAGADGAALPAVSC